MAEDGKVVYKVVTDDSQAVSGAKKSGGLIGDIMTGVAYKIGASFVDMAAKGAHAFLDLGKAAISSYGDYEQLIGGVETLFKSSSEEVIKNASAAYKTAGLSANDYMSTVTGFSASLLQSLGGDTVKAASMADMAITDMADNANKMGTSMESIQYAYQGFAKQNYTMLDNLKLGYGGTKEEMQRLLKDAEKLSGQKFDLSSYADIVEAVHVIQTEMEITGTTAKEASSTIQGSFSAMSAAWTNFLTGMADPSQDMDALMGNLVDSIVTFGENIIPRIVAMAPRLIQGIFQLAKTVTPKIIEMVQGLFPNILGALTEKIPELLTKGTEMAVSFMGSMASGLTESIPLILSQVLPILESLTGNLRENAGKLVDAGLNLIVNLVQGLINGLPQLIAYIPQIVINIAGVINDNLPKIIATGFKLIGSLIMGIINAVPELIANFPKIIEAIVAVFTAFNWMNLGKSLIDLLGKGIKAIAMAPVNAIRNIAQSVFDTFKNGFSWSSLGTNIIEGIKSGLGRALSGLVDAAKNVALSAFNAAKKALGIHSPSKEFMKLGVYSDKGMEKGFESGLPSLTQKVARLYTELPGAAMNAMDSPFSFSQMSRQAAEQQISYSLNATATTPNQSIEVPVYLNGREIARASAWNMGEQLAWEEL